MTAHRTPRALSTPEAVGFAVMDALLKHGAITIRVVDPPPSDDHSVMTPQRAVYVTAGARTWAEPIRRPLSALTDEKSKPADVAEAFTRAATKVCA